MESITTVVTSIMSWFNDILGVFTTNVFLLIPFGIGAIGGVVGIVKRIMGRRRG